ncbi:MAG: L-threonylcarbamoyladenylate synthase [Coriobacteriia bacterium]|nr:L-threonylcarbamoyladenylate synthase [Coriobacteriia bacterium]
MTSNTLITDKLADLRQIAELLKAGEAVVVPTDTVYGLAIMVHTQSDPEILFTIKQRPPEKSIPWLISSLDDLRYYTDDLPDWAMQLARRYWPGALTLVGKASAQAPPQFLADDGSLALRMPDHPLVLGLIAELDAPLATTSANISGQPPVARYIDIDMQIAEQVAGILSDPDEASTRDATPSTIISCLGDKPVVLRQGLLDLIDDLEKIFQPVE